ncbi:MAG: DUF1501 domain-containing protein [Nannocystaceae bacterium]
MIARRRFLAGVAGLAGGALLAAPRRARAAWGTWPEEHADLQLAPQRRASRVLELFVYGGLCPWDTLYCAPSWGRGEGRYLYAFGEPALAERLAACDVADDLDGGFTLPFAADAAGEAIHLGPWTAALWQRPDVLARTRVVVGRHDQFPHSTAIPLALTGSRLGRPELAGTAAAIARHFAELEGGASTPRACVIQPGDVARLDNLQSALAIGAHPSASRPLELNLGQLPQLLDLLQRPAVDGGAPAYDALVGRYRDRYAARLRRPSGAALDAPELRAWEAVDGARREAEALALWLPPGLFGLSQGTACGETRASMTTMGARVARHVLQREGAGEGAPTARYALWIDGGLEPTLDGCHDTHRDHLVHAPRNYSHTFATLAAAIADPAAPGDADDPTKLDLDDTLVVITSEFGRTPAREDEREGLGHWPGASVSALIGGPVTGPAQGGRAIVGAVDRETGLASAWTSPAELRMAILVALGIYPFAPGGFVASDVRGAADTRAALLRLRAILGVET